MQWTGMGKVAVANAGTPVVLSATSKKVAAVMVTYDPADAGATVYVKDNAGNIMAAMASASSQPVIFSAQASNQLDLKNFEIDSGANGKGPFVSFGTN